MSMPSPPPLSLSDDELSALALLAHAVPVDSRMAFLESVAAALAEYPMPVGVGTVHRVAADLQRRFIVAVPMRHVAGFTSKYR